MLDQKKEGRGRKRQINFCTLTWCRKICCGAFLVMAQLLNKRLEAQHTNAVGFFLDGNGCLLCVIVHAYVILSLRCSFFSSDAVIMNANASRQEQQQSTVKTLRIEPFKSAAILIPMLKNKKKVLLGGRAGRLYLYSTF